MQIYKIKNSDERVVLMIRGRTLNLVLSEHGNYKAVGDDEIEFLEEIDDGEDKQSDTE